MKARLIDEIGRTKTLTSGAQAAGVRVHTLPARPREVDDDGLFRYAVLGLSAASESGKASGEARRFLDETTGPDKPRVFRNAVILLTPSKDGVEVAMARVRDYLGWEQVQHDLREEEQRGGSLDPSRMATLAMSIDKARKKMPDAINQAYCIVVTISQTDDVQAFKITITDDPAFTTIKGDARSRIQDTAITADAMLPGGPYDLWKQGETSRRVKDLAGAFAQLPHLPKMLKARAILDTLVDGCAQGTFVLRLMRPDRTFRTWWKSKPDDAALNDPALELVLPHAAELSEIDPALLRATELPELWSNEQITLQDVMAYFSGGRVVQIEREGFTEPLHIPKAPRAVVEAAVSQAVEAGLIWLLAGPASLLGESIPPGLLDEATALRPPPPIIAPAETMPESLPQAWKDEATTALSLATALSQKAGRTLPWKTVRDAIYAALRARFIKQSGGPEMPCSFEGARFVELQVGDGSGRIKEKEEERTRNLAVAQAELEPSELQDLADRMPELLQLRARANVPIRFHLRIELGDGNAEVAKGALTEFNELLRKLKDGFALS